MTFLQKNKTTQNPFLFPNRSVIFNVGTARSPQDLALKLGEKACRLKTIMHLFKPQRLGVCERRLLEVELMWRALSQAKTSHLVKASWPCGV